MRGRRVRFSSSSHREDNREGEDEHASRRTCACRCKDCPRNRKWRSSTFVWPGMLRRVGTTRFSRPCCTIPARGESRGESERDGDHWTHPQGRAREVAATSTSPWPRIRTCSADQSRGPPNVNASNRPPKRLAIHPPGPLGPSASKDKIQTVGGNASGRATMAATPSFRHIRRSRQPARDWRSSDEK